MLAFCGLFVYGRFMTWLYTWLYRFLIFAPLLTFVKVKQSKQNNNNASHKIEIS